MDEEEVKLNLIQKLAKIRIMSDVVKRDQSGYGYKYADINEILAKVSAGMKKYNVSLIPMIVPNTFKTTQLRIETTKFTKSGESYVDIKNEMLIEAEMVFRWVNDDDLNETIEVSWHLVGSQSDPSQAFGSALTYCTRYFLVDYFQIAQPETDPDAYRSKQKEAEALEDKEVAEAIIAELDVLVNKYLAEHEDKRSEVKDLITKYIKGANYLKIKDSKTASKLLKEFKETYMSEASEAAEETLEEQKPQVEKARKKEK